MSSARRVSRWSEQEDRILCEKYLAQQARSAPKTSPDWQEVAASLPGRSNKDCRKRWCNVLSGNLRKGVWSPDEDELLSRAVAIEGPSWIRVAEMVPGRTADQCSKRWQHCLDPALDRSDWTEEENRVLVRAVEAKGRKWLQIRNEHFPGRSPNSLKNQFTIVSRRQKSRSMRNAEDSSSRTSSDRRDSLSSLFGLDLGLAGSEDSGTKGNTTRTMSLLNDLPTQDSSSNTIVSSDSRAESHSAPTNGSPLPSGLHQQQDEFPLGLSDDDMRNFNPLPLDMVNDNAFPDFSMDGDVMSGIEADDRRSRGHAFSHSIDSVPCPQELPVSMPDSSSHTMAMDQGSIQPCNQPSYDAGGTEIVAQQGSGANGQGPDLSMTLTVRSPTDEAINDVLRVVMQHRQHIIIEFNPTGDGARRQVGTE